MRTNFIISAIGVVVIFLSYFFWFSPLLMVIAGIVSLACLVEAIVPFFCKTYDETKGLGCIYSLFIAFVLLVAGFFMNSEWHISRFGDLRHLYSDCPKKVADKDYAVRSLSAYLWGCFNECDVCAQRKVEDNKKKAEELKAKEKKENLDFINSHIEELQEVRRQILKGEDVDVDDYSFRYEVEEYIRESAIDEYKDNQDYDYTPGVPSRYQ